MKDQRRKDEARVRAQAYAPVPTDSRLLYGVVSASLLLVLVLIVGGFYAVDPLRYPLALTGLMALAFGLGLIVRRVRLRRHRHAHRMEYDKAGEEAWRRD